MLSTTSASRGPRLGDFRADPATGVLMPPDAGTPAGYLDGAELRLRESLPRIGDRTTGSQELAALIEDWPTEYHLTPYRSTIFEALGFRRAQTARVLELGCGCGAVTRWLGEHCGRVDAIEGDPQRAHIAALRCEDLDNTHVYAANYSELTELEGYDVATLIGVLEYGHLYHPDHRDDPDGAAAANLRLVRRALSDDGLLVVAIENRLGLKYLNGAREDHSGRLFEGIQGYPDPTTPVTWSARALQRLLRDAGFEGADLLLPFPDYKLARTIVNPARCSDDHFVHNWIDAPAPDRGGHRGASLYNEHLATRELARAGVLPELSNSFLMLAWVGDRDSAIDRLGIDLDWSARHYSLDRKPAFRKQVTLRNQVVEHSPLLDGRDPDHDRRKLAAIGLQHQLGLELHRPGDALLFEVFESLTVEGVGPRFGRHLADFRSWLLARFPATGAPSAVDGRAFDATWWNVLVHPRTGDWQVIDEEWRLTGPIPVDFLLWRMVHHFAMRYRSDLPDEVSALTPEAFADACASSVAPDLSPALLEAFAQVDAAIQLAVSPGGSVERPAALDLLLALADPSAARYTVAAHAAEVVAVPALLAAYDRAAAHGAAMTLVVYAPDQLPEDAASSLLAAMAAAGVDDSRCDLVLLAVPDTPEAERSVVEHAEAVLSEGSSHFAAAALPHFGANDGEALARAAGASVASAGSPGGMPPAMPDEPNRAPRAENQVDDLEERADALGEHIDETRRDWEHKKHDPDVPGAAGDPDRAEGGLPPTMDKITPGD